MINTDYKRRTLRQHLATQMQQSRADRMLAYVAQHPGCSLPQICAGTGVTPDNGASQMSELTQRGRVYRAGLRTEYVYFANADQRDDLAQDIQQAQAARRKAHRAQKLREWQQRKKERLAKERMPAKPSQRKERPRHLTTHGMVQAYVDAHQGATARQIRDGAGVFAGSVAYAIQRLRTEGVLHMLGERGRRRWPAAYFTSRAAYDQARHDRAGLLAAEQNAAAAQRLAAKQQRRQQLDAARAAKADQQAARKALQQAAQDMRRAAAAEKAQAAQAAKAARQRLADQQREQRERRDAEMRQERQRRQDQPVALPAAPVVNLRPEGLAGSVTQTQHAGYVHTVIKAPRARYEVELQPGEGVISRDWRARREASISAHCVAGSKT